MIKCINYPHILPPIFQTYFVHNDKIHNYKLELQTNCPLIKKEPHLEKWP